MSNIKKIILVLLVIGLFPIFLISILNYKKTVNLMQKTIIEHLTANKNEKIRDLNDYLFHMDDYLTATSLKPSLQPVISNVIKTYETGGNNSQEYKESFLTFSKFMTRFFEVHTIYDMFIINIEGDIVSSMRKEDDLYTNIIRGKYKDTELSKIFKDAIGVNKQIVSDFSYYGPSGIPSAFMAQPLVDNGVTIGVLAIQINTREIYKEFKQYEGLGTTGETILAKKIEDKALFLNPLRYNQDTAFKYSVKIGSDNGRPIQEAVQGKSGSGTFIDYQKNEVLASWDYIPLLRMGIVVKQDTKEAYQSIETIRDWALFIGFIVVIIILFLIAYTSKIMNKIDAKKEQYEYAINGTSDGLWDWNLLEDTVYFSPRWKEMLGYRDDELPNDFKSWEEKVHPDDIDMAMKSIEESHNNSNIEYRHTHRLRHKDGSWVWILDRGQTIFNENGKAIRMVGFHTDITEQKEAEMLLKNAHKLLEAKKKELETIIQEAPNPIMLHNEDGEVLILNKVWEKLTGYKYDEINTIEKWTKKAYGKEMSTVEKYIDGLYKINKAVDEGEYQIIRSDGKVITWKFSSTPLGIINDKRTVITSAMDITELKNKEQLMIAQSRQAVIGEMISMIAHQWRQPITTISMLSNNILADIELDSLNLIELKEIAKKININTEELSKTIDDFRNFFKPDRIKELTKVNTIMESTISIIGKSLKNNNITLKMDKPKELKEINIYSRDLMQVLINIINNAKDILLEKKIINPTIAISYEQSNDKSAIFTICDNGGGIEENIIDKIFDPYFSTKKEKNGTGLGLYMSKMIVQKHLSGKISAYNEDGGACFKIELPYDIRDDK